MRDGRDYAVPLFVSGGSVYTAATPTAHLKVTHKQLKESGEGHDRSNKDTINAWIYIGK
jgi:hypothetical protein